MSNWWPTVSVDRAAHFAGLTLVAASALALVALLCARGVRHHPAARHCILFSALIWALLTPLVATCIWKSGVSVVPEALSSAVRIAWLKTSALNESRSTANPDLVAAAPQLANYRMATPAIPDPQSTASNGSARRRGNSAQSKTLAAARTPAGSSVDQVPESDASRGRGELSTIAGTVLRVAWIVLLSLWLVGSGLLLSRIAVGQIRVWSARRSLLLIPNSLPTAILDEVRRVLNLKTLPPVRMSDRFPTPCVVGIFRATVVLTRQSIELLDAAQLRDVLVHECAHALRHDCLAVLLQKVAAAAFWPSPLIHLLNWSLATVREEVCDNYVLAFRDRVSYGDTLLRFATIAGDQRPVAAAVGMLQRQGKLESRIAGLIDKRRNLATQPKRRLALLMTGVMGAICVAICGTPIAADQPAAQAASEQDETVGRSTTVQGLSLPDLSRAVKLVEGEPHTLSISDLALKLPIVIAKAPTRSRPLVMPGATALSPLSLLRIRAPFISGNSLAEVIAIGQIPEVIKQDGREQTIFRELRTGDRVSKGDVLAVFDSDAVRNKESDLQDATSKFNLDQEILKRAYQQKAALPDENFFAYRRNLVADKNAIERALASLRAWGIPDKEIQAIMDRAEKSARQGAQRDAAQDNARPQVTLRSPVDGIIIERNLAVHEVVSDNAINLFQIAAFDPARGGLKLTVTANCPEDEMAALDALPTNLRHWTISAGHGPALTGRIDDVSFFVDPNQHTAVVTGHVDNAQGRLRSGQFVKATVELPPPPDVVELPQEALSCDAQQCCVFVQVDPNKRYYRLRRVEVVLRFSHSAYVRSKAFEKGEERTTAEADQGLFPKEPLRPGERVLRLGVDQLKGVLYHKEALQLK